MIETSCGCDELDLVVAENIDSPFVGIESGALVVEVDVLLSVPVFVVLAFSIVSVGLFDVAPEFPLSIGHRSTAADVESSLAYLNPSEADLL